MYTTELLRAGDAGVDRTRLAVAGFLARYRGATRINYQSDLRCCLGWCHQVDIGPLDVIRAQLEVWVRHMEERQCLAPATVARRLSTVSGMFRFAHLDGLIEINPAEHVRRPRVPDESNRNGLDRMELGACIHVAAAAGRWTMPCSVSSVYSGCGWGRPPVWISRISIITTGTARCI